MPDDTRRAEAEQAYREWYATTEFTWQRVPASAFGAGYLAGDANGYARAIRDIRRCQVHDEERARMMASDLPRISHSYLRYARHLQVLADDLERGWTCTNPTHMRCQEKEADNV